MGVAATPTPTPTGSPSPTPSPSPTVTPTASPTQSDGTLQIITYRGYAEYGATTPKANWVGTFERVTGCRVAKLDTVQTSEEMAERVAKQPYDLISASPDLAGDLIATKQVQPIDPAKVAGFTDIPKRLRDMTTQAGKVYGVPYLWGFDEFLYDSGKVKGGTLADVFGSDKVALADTPMTIADAALTDTSVDDPFQLSKTQLDAAMTLLGQHKDRVYWKNPLDLVKGFATGSLEYAQATPYYRVLLQNAGLPVKAVEAKRTTGWLDSWMLGANTANTPNLECAYRWLTWTAAPTAQRAAATWMGLAPANAKACKVKGKLIPVCEIYGADKPSGLDRVAFEVRPPDYAAWTDRWHGLIG